MALITRNDPWSLFDQLRREMERATAQTAGEEGVTAADWVPAVDIREQGDSFVIVADLPGVQPKDIEVSTENGALIIKGSRDTKKKEEREGYKRIERVHGTFFRRFTLPDTADVEKIQAKSEHGVLEVRIPKHEKLMPRKINVNVQG
ncbi:MAG TPA: Hsp20/alpha crystallin family protein [Fibrobacteria bacterium]|nr:Hsp20/alpha crystallin family protein [Fibrobacteria bacterium]